MNMNVVCIIQARTGSMRLPNKIFLDLQGKAVLGQVIERVQGAKRITKIVIAAPDKPADDVIENYVREHYRDIGVSRGSENDVLDRYYQAAKAYEADLIVRITSDCPLVDPVEIDTVIEATVDQGVDYGANILGTRTYPRGLDTEVFRFSTLEKMWQDATEAEDREHVTLYLRKHPELFSTCNVVYHTDYSGYRITLDTPEDYELIQIIYKELYPSKLDIEHVVALLDNNTALIEINKHIKQKYGQF